MDSLANPGVDNFSDVRPRWKGRDSLDVVHRFNERCFQLISNAASTDIPCIVPAIHDNRDLWRDLDDAACSRAARLPFVIVDARFRDVAWWREAINGAAPVSMPLDHRLLAEQLMEETLLFAAQTVNWSPMVARETLGMSRGVAGLLKGLPPQPLANIWRRHSGELGLRWEQKTKFWRALLLAASGNDTTQLVHCQRDAQLLWCADMVRSHD